MIRMIVTDLDGTLLAGGNNIPEKNIAALRRAMDAGVQVVLCSGRMIEATLPIAEAVEANAPMVLFNGAMVYDRENDRILSGHTIPRETAVTVLKEIEEKIHANVDQLFKKPGKATKGKAAATPVEEAPAAPANEMRLDKFLKVSRIIKRRSVANDACDADHVSVNGKPGKPGMKLKVGDVLTVRYGANETKYEVLSIAESVRKEAAAEMYRIVP